MNSILVLGSVLNKPNILFLMSDSMDGRVLDPTSPVSSRLELPHLRRLAALGTNNAELAAGHVHTLVLRL